MSSSNSRNTIVCSEIYFSEKHLHYVETSQLMRVTNQLTGVCMIRAITKRHFRTDITLGYGNVTLSSNVTKSRLEVSTTKKKIYKFSNQYILLKRTGVRTTRTTHCTKYEVSFKSCFSKFEQIYTKRAKSFNNTCRGNHNSNFESYVSVKIRIMVNIVGLLVVVALSKTFISTCVYRLKYRDLGVST